MEPVEIINMNVSSLMRVASPLVWQGYSTPQIEGLLEAAAAVIDSSTFDVQRDAEGEYVLFEPWLYWIETQPWKGERSPYRGGASEEVKIRISSHHVTEALPSNDFLNRKPVKKHLLKAQNIATAMGHAVNRAPGQLVLEALAANDLLGYDGQPTFSNNHADILGKTGLSNVGKLGVDFAPRNNLSKPTKLELFEELLLVHNWGNRNRKGLVRFEKKASSRNLTVIVRSEETSLAFERLNKDRMLTRDEENSMRDTLDIIEDYHFAEKGLDPNTYDVLFGSQGDGAAPKAYAYSTVRPVLGMEFDNEHFKEKKVYFGADFDYALGPWFWQGAFRAEPS